MPNLLIPFRFLSFLLADDLKIIKNQNYLSDFFPVLESWAALNEMSFHPKKTQIVNFFSGKSCYVFCDTDVEVVELHRHLTLIVSSNLSWTEHVSVRLAKALNTFHQIRRNCSVKIGVRAKLDLYKSTVLSLICYASACWFANRGDMRRPESLQKKTSKWNLPLVADYRERFL